jgi:hypothetical protein
MEKRSERYGSLGMMGPDGTAKKGPKLVKYFCEFSLFVSLILRLFADDSAQKNGRPTLLWFSHFLV